MKTNELKMKLATDEEIRIKSFGVPLHVVADCDSQAAALELWGKLTPEALASVEFYDGEEKTARFENVKIDSTQFVTNDYGAMTVHFYMHGKNRSAEAE